jgi:hypothetical protein
MIKICTLNIFLVLGLALSSLALSTASLADEVSDRIQAQQRQQQADNEQGYQMQQQQQADADAYWAENGAAIMAAEAENRARRQAALNDDDANRTSDWWGAISVNVRTGAWGNALQRTSGAQAMADVKEVCPDADCALLALFRNTCVAGVTNAAGSAFWADDVKPRKALNAATKKCRADPASGRSCEAPKDFNVCSGYAYQKYDGKLSNYNRGGLIGVLAPGLSNIPDLAPAQVIYNPSLVQFTAQTSAVRTTGADAALAANQSLQEGGALPLLWGAIATGQAGGALGLGMGISEDIAKADAVKKCAVSDCVIQTSYQGDICIAVVTGKNAQGNDISAMDAQKTKAEVEAKLLDGCVDKGITGCKIKMMECMDLTP